MARNSTAKPGHQQTRRHPVVAVIVVDLILAAASVTPSYVNAEPEARQEHRRALGLHAPHLPANSLDRHAYPELCEGAGEVLVIPPHVEPASRRGLCAGERESRFREGVPGPGGLELQVAAVWCRDAGPSAEEPVRQSNRQPLVGSPWSRPEARREAPVEPSRVETREREMPVRELRIVNMAIAELALEVRAVPSVPTEAPFGSRHGIDVRQKGNAEQANPGDGQRSSRSHELTRSPGADDGVATYPDEPQTDPLEKQQSLRRRFVAQDIASGAMDEHAGHHGQGDRKRPLRSSVFPLVHRRQFLLPGGVFPLVHRRRGWQRRTAPARRDLGFASASDARAGGHDEASDGRDGGNAESQGTRAPAVARHRELHEGHGRDWFGNCSRASPADRNSRGAAELTGRPRSRQSNRIFRDLFCIPLSRTANTALMRSIKTMVRWQAFVAGLATSSLFAVTRSSATEKPNDDSTTGLASTPAETATSAPRRDFERGQGALGSLSVGHPHEGFLVNGVRMPKDVRWWLADPDGAWGTAETVDALTHCIDRVFEKHPDSPPAIVGSLSRRGGGPYPPHKSHQSGRDADVYLWIKDRGKQWYVKGTAETLDRARTWTFIRAVVTETDVEYILLDQSVQPLLEEYALKRETDPAWVRSLFHGDDAGTRPLIKHVPGHTGHMHVRFYNRLAQERGRRAYDRLVEQDHLALPRKGISHKVEPNETLSELAVRYNTQVATIRELNDLTSDLIKAGQVLRIEERVDLRAARAPVVIPPRRLPRGEGTRTAARPTDDSQRRLARTSD